MSSATHLPPGQSAYPFPSGWDSGIVLKDASVNVSGLSSRMVNYLVVCQRMHVALFGVPMCVTSGNDGAHAPHSKHSEWKAVDIRITDIDQESQLVFLVCLRHLSRPFKMAVFDEGNLEGAGHFHVEEVG